MSIDDLAEFLLARIAEDEAAARGAGGLTWSAGAGIFYTHTVEDSERQPVIYDEGAPTEAQADHIAAWSPARVLIECEAKRQLIELAQGLVYLREIGDPVAPSTPVGQDILEILAVPYADHPDYREEWRA